MTLGRWPVFVAVFAALALCACTPPAEVRYRMTVEVEDGGVVRAGSSVWSFRLGHGLLGGYAPHFEAEAITVDLPGRGMLFALVGGPDINGWPTPDSGAMLPEILFFRGGQLDGMPKKDRNDRVAQLRWISNKLIGQTVEIDCATQPAFECPYMVTFVDPPDPASIVRVDPLNLAARFGRGVRLRRITMEVTRDGVTHSIRKSLPWLADYNRLALSGVACCRTDNPALGARMSAMNFSINY